MHEYLITGNSSARSERLEKVYSSPRSEVYLFLYHAMLQLFVSFNKFWKREDPTICVMHDQLHSFMKSLMGKFVSVSAIRDALSAGDITRLNYDCRENQLSRLVEKHG